MKNNGGSTNSLFSIRVQNGYKTPSTFTVKHLQILLKSSKDSLATTIVTMDTRLVAKVNKTVVQSDYKKLDQFEIERIKYQGL